MKFSNPAPQPHRLRSSQANDYEVQQLGQIGKIAITAQARLIRNLFVCHSYVPLVVVFMFLLCVILTHSLIRSAAFRYQVRVLGPT